MPNSQKELRERGAKRNLGQELLQSVREMKAGRRGRVRKIKSLGSARPIPEGNHARQARGSAGAFKDRRTKGPAACPVEPFGH